MKSAVLDVRPLGFPWETFDPFLFCVYHDDKYPRGNDQLGPAASLAERQIGQDFARKDQWNMYHGAVVPGFPQHPHRGFETVTMARRGYIDHSDSLGATARFGAGDVQWLTAGAGVVHSEMFPLLRKDEPNPLELFQIWLNLARADKMAPAHFTMLWNRDLPRIAAAGAELVVVAGDGFGVKPLAPPPRSYATKANADVAIVTIALAAGGRVTLPPAASALTNRTLYYFAGEAVTIAGENLKQQCLVRLDPTREIVIEAGASAVELLLLQGRPIGEPVAQHGPFVMNTMDEVRTAFADFRRTGFGGWPWPSDDPNHGPTTGRFAKHADGKIETPDEKT